MFVIINMGVCCHYQIEGGVFTTRDLAEKFAEGRVDKYTTLTQLHIVEVPLDPVITTFKQDSIGSYDTDIWP